MQRLFTLVLLLTASSLTMAGPADDARTHFNAIANGDLAILGRSYHDNAMLEWVGGPLDGTYTGREKIDEVWAKFGKANPELKLTVDKVEESANAKGGTVTANVLFTGKNPIKVRFVLTFRDSRITSEIWQIDPKLAIN